MKDSNQLPRRILVTGGAGFLGSHLCERLIVQGHEVLCLDNYFTGSKQNVAHMLARPNFELVRHDVTLSAVRRGGADLQPGLPSIARALSERPSANHQNQRTRGYQHAGACQAHWSPYLASIDQ